MNAANSGSKVETHYLENPRWGYQVAISNAQLYANTFWTVFNTMIVANSIVIAGISFVSSTQSPSFFTNILALIGLLLCFIWFLFGTRHRELAAYYQLAARELEETYLSKTLRTLSRVVDFAEGRVVTIKLGQTELKRSMSFWARLTNRGFASSIIIIAFVVIYMGAFFI